MVGKIVWLVDARESHFALVERFVGSRGVNELAELD